MALTHSTDLPNVPRRSVVATHTTLNHRDSHRDNEIRIKESVLAIPSFFLFLFCLHIPVNSEEPSQKTTASLQTQSSELPRKIDPVEKSFETMVANPPITETQKVELRLGEQFCGEEITIRWTLKNPTNTEINWPRATTACGCVTGFPSSIVLPADKSQELTFRIKLPTVPEKLGRQITFWDLSGNAQLSATILADVVEPIRPDPNVVTLLREDAHTIHIPLAPLSEQVNIEDYKATVSGPEIIQSSLKIDSPSNPQLVVEVDPQKLPSDFNQSLWALETVRSNGAKSQTQVRVTYPNRQSVSPNPILFANNADKRTAKAVVVSPMLKSQLERGHPIIAYRISRSSEISNNSPHIEASRYPVKVTVLNDFRTSPTASVAIDLQIEQQDTLPSQFELTLSCGNWNQAVDAIFNNPDRAK